MTSEDLAPIQPAADALPLQPGGKGLRSRKRTVTKWLGMLLLTWLAIAYLLIPWAYERYAEDHPGLDESPRVTRTGDRHPGDPLNVGLVGSRGELEEIFRDAKWFPAAALGLESDLKIAADTVLSRPDDAAPVSSLYLFGRKEDLAFEQPVGDSPRHRHHVRLWKMADPSKSGRTQWIGAAVYDERVGFSRTTGEITHITAPDVDTERDYLFKCLEVSGELASHSVEQGFHTELEGTNGGGDLWRTDGDLYWGVVEEKTAGEAPTNQE